DEPWIAARDAAVMTLLYGCVLRISEALDLTPADLQKGSTTLRITGIELYSLGDFADGDDREEIVLRDASAGVYKRM
ncbi:hypothetical protein AB9F45_39940, partial [Rhizobium leguminosarum]